MTTLISLVTVFAAFAVPAGLALRYGVDSRVDRRNW
jgi:hypothetical protein